MGSGGRPAGRVIKKYEAVEFHELMDPKQYPQSWNLFKNSFGPAFQALFDLPPALLRGEFRRMIDEKMEKVYPKLRKSAARMFIEGDLTGGVSPLTTVPVGAGRRLEVALSFLDLLETMVYVQGMLDLEEKQILAVPETRYIYRPLSGRGKKAAKAHGGRVVASGGKGTEAEEADVEELEALLGEEGDVDDDESDGGEVAGEQENEQEQPG